MTPQPLADRLRPQTFEDYVGQRHLIGKNAILRSSVISGVIPSFILWGPPGVGKTTLAQLIALQLKRPFFQFSAINSGVRDIREAIEQAQKCQASRQSAPVLFIDEIHRFNKAQQDALLGSVEKGVLTLIGATTENPSFEVIAPLLSRCQVYILKPLAANELRVILQKALTQDQELRHRRITIKEDDLLLRYSGGDARKLLNLLELVVHTSSSEQPANQPTDQALIIDNALVARKLHENPARYDKNADQHYDIISAFIKSIRGSDPHAAVYWLARLVAGGEDPKFIARRLVILATEDIGLANPTALVLANSCFEAVNRIGWPESRIILSQAAIYLATSPKSNSAYQAISDAQELVKHTGDQPVPLHLRNAPTRLMSDLGYGRNYRYAHDFEDNFVVQEFMPQALEGHAIYKPGGNPREKELQARLKLLWGGKYDRQGAGASGGKGQG